MARWVALGLVLLLLVGWGLRPEDTERSAADWVEHTLESLTLSQKAGQVLAAAFTGTFRSEDDPAYRELLRQIKLLDLGGVIFFRGYPMEQAALINDLQRESFLPLLVAQDMEWGAGMRLTGTTVFPRAMALGATRDPRLAYAMGTAIAREARALGVQQNYAPVADVNNNPLNPIINVRAFGEDPELVASFATAYVRGLQEHGVLATVKHFPGHGDTEMDSHAGLPVLPFSAARLDSLELFPFRAALRQKVRSVMVGHLALPALEPDSAILPATLSPTITTDLLRDSLGFRGLVVTDAMNMEGVTRHFGVAEAAVRALEAGADMVLMSQDLWAAHKAIMHAVRSGRLPEARLNEAVRHVLEAKAWAGLHRKRTVRLEAIRQHVRIARHVALSQTIAQRSITLLRNENNLLPLPERPGRILHVVLSDDDDPNTGRAFLGHLREVAPGASFHHHLLDVRSTPADYQDVLEEARDFDLVLVAAHVYVRSWKGEIELRPEQKTFLNRLIRRRTAPVILVAFGNPYLIMGLQARPQAYLAAYGGAESTQRAVAQALFGQIPVGGRLPITIPGYYAYGEGLDLPQIRLRSGYPEEVGMDSRRLQSLDDLLHRAVLDSVAPAIAVGVGRAGVLVHSKGYGHLTYTSDVPVTPRTRFDLASLTKVVGTTTAIMKLYEEGRLRLNDPVQKYLPEFRGPKKRRVTLKHLLTHTGGLRPFFPFHRYGITHPDSIRTFILRDTLQYAPGARMVYSDFDMILLGMVVEKVTGKDLATYLRETFFEPMGMLDTDFLPVGTPVDSTTVAPTEVDTTFRHRLVWGEVHDETAWLLGGVAGHAGLFSTVEDLARFAQMLLNGGTYNGHRFLKPETIALFTRPVDPVHHTRALGWDTRSPQGYSSAGHYFGPRSFGHTGFTGTSLWIDPDQQLFVILLTNRVYPTRANRRHIALRPAVADAAFQAIVGPPQPLMPEPYDWRALFLQP